MDFTLLRLLLALSVVFAHYGFLTGASPWWAQGPSATVAVQAFFVVSGWIVTASCEASASGAAFFVRRMVRLYPLYATVVIAQAFVALCVQGWSHGAWAELTRYLAANLAFANFLKPSLLGFLDGAPVDAINPSLWTMKVEVAYYLCVPLLVMLNRRHGTWALLAVFVASTLFYCLVGPVSAELAKQLPGQMRFFVAGMLGRLLLQGVWDPKRLNAWAVGAIGMAGLMLAQRFDSGYTLAAVQPLFVLVLVVAGAMLLPAMDGAPDISFGVYLLHAPLIQFTHQTGWLAPGTQALAITLAMTVVLALAAHYLIERPAIRAGARWSRRISTADRAATKVDSATTTQGASA